jgi:hypothetical protein
MDWVPKREFLKTRIIAVTGFARIKTFNLEGIIESG